MINSTELAVSRSKGYGPSSRHSRPLGMLVWRPSVPRGFTSLLLTAITSLPSFSRRLQVPCLPPNTADMSIVEGYVE